METRDGLQNQPEKVRAASVGGCAKVTPVRNRKAKAIACAAWTCILSAWGGKGRSGVCYSNVSNGLDALQIRIALLASRCIVEEICLGTAFRIFKLRKLAARRGRRLKTPWL